MTDPMNETKLLMQAAAYENDGRLILLTQTGSRAYGTDNPQSDHDFRGVYMASLPRVLSLSGAKQSLAMTQPHDTTVYELHHFCKLAAAANPTVLELLWADQWWNSATLGAFLRENRSLFLSKLIVRTYGGYALGQLKKARDGTGGVRGQEHYKRTKFKLHTLRLLDAGVAALETGEVQVRVPDPQALREAALGDFEYIEALAKQKMAAMDRAACNSSLPDAPDYAKIDKLIYEMRSNG